MASKKVECPKCHRNVKPRPSSDRRKLSCPNCGAWFGADADDDNVLDLPPPVARQAVKQTSRPVVKPLVASRAAAADSTTPPVGAPPLTPPPFTQVKPHLVGERFDVLTRQRVYQRLRETYEHGYRDPELLYLAARYALALGRLDEARAFLNELAPSLQADGRPSQAYLPVGLLLHTAVPPAERARLISELHASADGSPRLVAALRLAGCVPPEELVPGSPQQLLHVFEQDGRALSPQLAALLNANGDEQTAAADGQLKQLQSLAQTASAAYNANELPQARAALERMLLIDGAQPAALRNLITITSEQQDVEAYERYWRRYVKVLLWRVLCDDDAPAAYDELLRFYSKVAVATDREFNELTGKLADKLRTPGLLPRWLEAHAALVWLDALTRPPRPEVARAEAQTKRGAHSHLRLMRYWCRVFYPEFYRFIDVGTPPVASWAAELQRAPARPSLPFDPALVLLARFAEWSNFNFWLLADKETQELADDEYAELISALGGCAMRIPVQPYLSAVQKKLETFGDSPPPFRRLWQEACSVTVRAHRDQLWKAEDWAGVVAHYGGPELDPELLDMLTPMSRLYLADALCLTEREADGLDVACRLLPDLLPAEFDEESPTCKWWLNILYANLKQAAEAGTSQALTRITDRLAQVPPLAAAPEFIAARIKEAVDYNERVRTSAIMEQVRASMDSNNFEAAVQLVKTLPDTTAEAREYRQSMLEQVQLEQAFERIKPLVRDSKFKEAKTVVRGVTVKSEVGQKRRDDILGQIAEIEQERKEAEAVNKLVDAALARAKECIGRSAYAEARAAIRRLPDQPADMPELKRSFLKQIDEAEQGERESARLNLLIDDALAKAKACIQRGAYNEARQAIRALPNSPADLAELKRKYIAQIDESEAGEKTVRRENDQIIAYLRRQNVDFLKVGQIARENRIDTKNPYDYNSLLKAIQKQVRGY